MTVRTLLVVPAAFVPVIAAAQPVDPAVDQPGPVIVVTGQGLEDTPSAPAYDTQVITREQIVSEPSGRVENALALVAGFQQFRRSDSRSANPSAQGATLRALGGNATSRALVLFDGVPMSDPFFGYVPFNAFAPEQLGEIRVARGGGSGPFGAGALTGTIELASAGPEDTPPFALRALVNQRGDTEAGVGLSGSLGRGFVAGFARWNRGPGFHTTPADQRVAASVRASFEDWTVGLRSAVPVTSDIELQTRALLYRDTRELRFAGATSRSEAQDASVRLVGRGRWQFDLLGYVQQRDFGNIVISSTRFVPVLNQRATPSTGVGGKIEMRPPLGRGHTLRVGADYREADGELYEVALSALTGAVTERRRAGGVNTDLGLFVEHDATLGPVTLTAGARADHYRIADGFFRAQAPDGTIIEDTAFPGRSGWRASFRGGALVRLGDAIAVRAAAYTGLRLPTLNELYRPFVVFPVETRANADLRNETLRGAELGVDYERGTLRLFATAFANRLDDAIANVTIGENLRQRRNIDAIVARGLEAGGGWRRGSVSLDASLSLTDAEMRNGGAGDPLDGRRPAQTPRIVASGRLSWAPAKDSVLALSVLHVGSQFEDDLETDRLPAYTTLGAYAKVPVRRGLALVLRAENLTDETIVTRNSGGSIDLGVPRTLWAGFDFDL